MHIFTDLVGIMAIISHGEPEKVYAAHPRSCRREVEWDLDPCSLVPSLCPVPYSHIALSMCSALFYIVSPISPPPHEVGSTFRSALPGLRLFEARWFSAFRSFQIFRRQFNSCTRCNKIPQQGLGQHFIINVTISTKQDRN